jgi:hypothetical protein
MRKLILLPLLLVLASCGGKSAQPLPRGTGKLLVTFAAMGDVPYEQWENDLLKKQAGDSF